MADLQLTIKPSTSGAVPGMPRRTVEVTYSRRVAAASRDAVDAQTVIQETAEAVLGEDATATVVLNDVEPKSPALVRFLSGTGSSRLERAIPAVGQGEMSLELTAADVKALAQPELTAEATDQTVRRLGQLVPVTTIPVSFTKADFRVAIIDPADWKKLGLDQVFSLATIQTSSAEFRPEALPEVASLAWTPAHLGVNGGFDIVFPASPRKAWAWWLVDRSNVALGVVNDDLAKPRAEPLALPLPPFAAPAEAGPGHHGPRARRHHANPSSTDNPDVFTRGSRRLLPAVLQP